MSDEVFLLETSGTLISGFHNYVERPEWLLIENSIEAVYKAGGDIKLRRGQPGHERSQGFIIFESLCMEAISQKFRLVYFPKVKNLKGKLEVREWRDFSKSPDRKLERFGDDEWDASTICSDINVAKNIFKEYFDNEGVADYFLSQVRSIWAD